jgi:hypothetical protein
MGTLIWGKRNINQWQITSMLQVMGAIEKRQDLPYQMNVMTIDGIEYTMPFQLGEYSASTKQWFKVFVPTTKSIERIQIMDKITNQILYTHEVQKGSATRQVQMTVQITRISPDRWEIPPMFQGIRIIRRFHSVEKAWRVIGFDRDQTPFSFNARSGDRIEIQYSHGLHLKRIERILP